MIKVAVSGGFDPIHTGHIRLLENASRLGDWLVVILNSDEWLRRKKGRPFMTWAERAHILRSIRYVDQVVSVDDTDGTVCAALEKIKPDVFANGGDRLKGNTPEDDLCDHLGIKPEYSVGGSKIQSSSELLRNYA